MAIEIFTLARYLVSTRTPDTDAGREACLRRAAEIVLEGGPGVDGFVLLHRDAFLAGRKEMKTRRSDRACVECGAVMHESTRHDADVGDWMPVWACARCGAEVPR